MLLKYNSEVIYDYLVPIDNIDMIEIVISAESHPLYPYCLGHTSSINPYGLGIIPSSACEHDVKLFVMDKKFMYQFQVNITFL